MYEIMGNTLRSLYTCPRGLLRWRRWELGVIVRTFFMVKFPEFLGSSTYRRLTFTGSARITCASTTRVRSLLSGQASYYTVEYFILMLFKSELKYFVAEF